ncbi:hypothetical protein AHF37_11986 [Paragonimus kellicotti]|nr:hypothetical protein AHF37_11986 [Paragonimus kellicotti]
MVIMAAVPYYQASQEMKQKDPPYSHSSEESDGYTIPPEEERTAYELAKDTSECIELTGIDSFLWMRYTDDILSTPLTLHRPDRSTITNDLNWNRTTSYDVICQQLEYMRSHIGDNDETVIPSTPKLRPSSMIIRPQSLHVTKRKQSESALAITPEMNFGLRTFDVSLFSMELRVEE